MSSRNANTLVLWTALGWAAGLSLAPLLIGLAIRGIETVLDVQLIPDFGGALCNLFLGPAAGGAVGGYVTASALRRSQGLQGIHTRTVVWIWAGAMLLATISMLVFGGMFLAEPPLP